MLSLNVKGMKRKKKKSNKMNETSSKGSLEDPPKRVNTRSSSYYGRRLDNARVSERLDNPLLSEVLK